MHYSGILVVVSPGRVRECAREIETLPGLEVHYRYPDNGQIIAVQESRTMEAQKSGLRSVRSLPGVVLAELVYHHVDAEDHEVEEKA